ncbi:TPA: glycosyltransferase [Providencia rettgeri]|nr:glycosyltransferase [Providencia rettgeri]
MFSVVITTKDRINYLSRAVHSIMSNSILPSEIIIINDGGAQINDAIFDIYSIPIRVFNNKVSKGANYSRNIGIKKSQNDIVFLLDDDDALLENSFETRLVGFKNPKVGISFTGIRIVKDNNLKEIKRILMTSPYTPTYYNLLKHGNLIGSTSRVALRKSYFNQVNGFDESLPCLQDYDLWIRLSQISDTYFDGSATVLYTIHNTNLNNKQISQNYRNYINTSSYLLKKYEKEINKQKLTSNFKSNLYLRISLSASKSNFFIKYKFAALSFINRPNIKALSLIIIPRKLLFKLFPYV